MSVRVGRRVRGGDVRGVVVVSGTHIVNFALVFWTNVNAYSYAIVDASRATDTTFS